MMSNSRDSLQTDFSQVLTQVLCCEDLCGFTFNASMIRKQQRHIPKEISFSPETINF